VALYPVIMAGGSGTRFWPLSRKQRPKQFLPLTGDKPLIVHAVENVAPLASPEQTFVVCGKVHAPVVRELLPQLPGSNVLVEPIARNTAPCIGLAAAAIAARDPEGILLVLPSDHHIGAPERFRAALARAAEAAKDGMLVTIGIKPSRPETGYGYVHRGEVLREGELPIHAVRRFVEKPDLTTAQSYLASGDYLWNAGIFVFRADRILEELRRHLPETQEPLAQISDAFGRGEPDAVLAEQFPRMPAISIDYGVMEKASNIAVVPADFGWSDVGSFTALPEVRAVDDGGNVAGGQTLLIDVKDSVVLADGRPIAVVGVEGLVIVDAGDAVLVCPKDRAQDVRKIVDELGRRGLQQLL
jgi:mannose-1-phosphate guanylyltransferase